jgi:hypothetical protein
MTVKVFFSRSGFFNLFVIALIFGALGCVDVIAQEPVPTPPKQGDSRNNDVKIETDLVTLTLTVTDNYGRFVSGLEKDAFRVWDEKTKQNITFFSDSDAPV